MADIQKIMEVCLLSGKIMLSNGAETYRVEDTMSRIAHAFHVRDVYSFATPTGIFLTLQDENTDQTKFIRIFKRSIDLNKVVRVNDISRKISAGELMLDEAHEFLLEVERALPIYPYWQQIAAASAASGFFSLLFEGSFKSGDFAATVISGGIGFVLYAFMQRVSSVKFVAELVAAFSIGAIVQAIIYLGLGMNRDIIMIGSVMPLVPGVLITNAVRDLMAGDLVSGLSRGAESFLTAIAIGTGIAAILGILPM